MMTDDRPDPDSLLKAIQKEEQQQQSGQLKIFFGMSAGVGKTFAMLKAAHERLAEGWDVVIGTVDTHDRKDTAALVEGLPILPRREINYKGTVLKEMDLDAILKRKPRLAIVDELAHTNAPGSRHHKRYQDVLELLDNGIDVYTSLNVQHLESRKEAIEQIARVTIRETVPDSILERASQIALVDLSPEELLKRLKEGKVYLGQRAEQAQEHFFQAGPLTALREIALRITAEKVDQELQDYMQTQQIQGPWKTAERLMVAVSHSPYSERLIRATRRIAFNLEASWIAVNIDTGVKLNEADQLQLMSNLNLVRELGGEVVATTDSDIQLALQRIARQRNITQIVIGRPTRRWLRDLIEGGSLLERLVRESGEFDVHVIRQESRGASRRYFWQDWAFRSRAMDFVHVTTTLIVALILCRIALPYIGYRAVGFVFLLVVLGVSLFCSMGPILFAALSSMLVWDFFFIPPEFTFYIVEKEDIIMCVMYLTTALTTGFLTSRIRFHQRLLRDRESRMALLYDVVSGIVKAPNQADMIRIVCERVEQRMQGRCEVLLHDQILEGFGLGDATRLVNTEKEMAVAAWVLRSNKRAGWSTETLSEATALYLPLYCRDQCLGVLVYCPRTRSRWGMDRENLLATVANQLAIALARYSARKVSAKESPANTPDTR
jgi:two-component system sensor histidine kinase KdpD